MYLNMLYTLCIAYARAGIQALRNEAPETWRTEPTDYIIAPLDLMLRYHHRAEVKVRMIPASQALAWLQTRDEEERTLWVERYRSSDLTFGQVVKEKAKPTSRSANRSTRT
jgi:putative SOS response-associated peptidase YedK